jgi:two-component system sensor histidine kinase HydH
MAKAASTGSSGADVWEETAQALLLRLIQVRLVAVPFLVAIAVLFFVLAPDPWRVWWLSLTFLPLVALFAVEGVMARRGRGFLGMSLNLVGVILLQGSLFFASGGIESPLLKLYPAFALLVGLFLGRPRRVLPTVAVLVAITLVLASGPLYGYLPRTVPDFLRMGPGFWDRPVYVWTTTAVLCVFMVMSSQVGAMLRRTLNDVGREAVAVRRQALEVMAARNRELASVANTLAHELKNPLASIQGLGQLLERDAGQGTKTSERLRVMLSEIGRMTAVLDEFRNLTRPLSDLTVKPTPLSELLGDVVALNDGIAQRQGTRLVLDEPGELSVECDGQKVKQALVNLIQNGLEAVAAGGRLTLRAVPDADGSRVRIEVADTGPGLGAEAARNLFVTGFTTKGHGSGIGLVVARTIAEQHGGSLTVSNGRSGGCLATLELPCRQAAGAPLGGGDGSAPLPTPLSEVRP